MKFMLKPARVLNSTTVVTVREGHGQSATELSSEAVQFARNSLTYFIVKRDSYNMPWPCRAVLLNI